MAAGLSSGSVGGQVTAGRSWRAIAWVVVGLGLAMVGWWFLFRPLVEENPVVGRITYRRVLGPIVAVEGDRDGDGRTDIRVVYKWSQPYQGVAGGLGCLDYGQHWEDRNKDGRWDTWYEPVGEEEDGSCRYGFSVDTDLDGVPDWMFESVANEATFGRIERRRGF